MALIQQLAAKFRLSAVSGAQTVSFPSSVIAGNDVYTEFTHYNGGVPGNRVSGVTLGGTAGTLVVRIVDAANQNTFEVWAAVSVTGGTANVSITLPAGGGQYLTGMAYERDDIVSVTPNRTGTANGVSAAPSATTSAATTVTPVLLVGGFVDTVGTNWTSATQPAGWTLGWSESDGTTFEAGAGGYLVDSGAVGSKTGTWSTSSSMTWSAVIAALELSAGGGGSQNQQTDAASRKNRPGRGPLSLGRWFVRDRKDQGFTVGVQTYAVAVAEGVTTAEAVAAAMAASAAGAEAVAATDSVAAAGVFVRALAEAAAGGDVVGAAMLLVASITDPAAAAESLVAATSMGAAIAEAAATTEAAAGTTLAGAAVTEPATTGDSQAASLQAGAAVAEPATAAETVTTGPVLASVLTESVTLTEALAVFSQLVRALSESLVPADAVAATQITGAAVTEPASAAEQTSTGPVVTASVAEIVAAAEAIVTAASLLATVLEAASAAEALTTAAQLGALLTEPAAPADSVAASAATTHNVAVAEIVTALETLVAALVSGSFNPSAPPAVRREAAARLTNLQTALRGRNTNRGSR